MAIQCANELQMNASLLVSSDAIATSVETIVRLWVLSASALGDVYVAELGWNNCRPWPRWRSPRGTPF
jgi:hypothetical protein